MVRGIARGWRVAVVQFVKSGDWKVGEEKIGRQLGVDWLAVGDGFTWDSDDLEHDKALARDGWDQAAELIAAGEHQLVILDELTYLCTWGWIDTPTSWRRSAIGPSRSTSWSPGATRPASSSRSPTP